jgi:hypothetical protein
MKGSADHFVRVVLHAARVVRIDRAEGRLEGPRRVDPLALLGLECLGEEDLLQQAHVLLHEQSTRTQRAASIEILQVSVAQEVARQRSYVQQTLQTAAHVTGVPQVKEANRSVWAGRDERGGLLARRLVVFPMLLLAFTCAIVDRGAAAATKQGNVMTHRTVILLGRSQTTARSAWPQGFALLRDGCDGTVALCRRMKTGITGRNDTVVA